MDGESLVPLMGGAVASIKPVAVSQFHRKKVLMGYAFRNERYRYIVWLRNEYRSNQPFREDLIDAEELYDYETDPLETKNYVNDPEYAVIKEEMLLKAQQFFKEQQ